MILKTKTFNSQHASICVAQTVVDYVEKYRLVTPPWLGCCLIDGMLTP